VLWGRRRRRAPGKAIEVDGMLWGWRRQRALGEAVDVEGEAVDVEGEAVEATVYSVGEAVEGALRRSRHAPGIGGVEDLKRASGENLLSVEQAART
jgi:hypothetical protein